MTAEKLDLDELERKAKAATPGPWEPDTIDSEDGSGKYSAYVMWAPGQRIFDSINAPAEIHEEPDDFGIYAWDDLAKRNFEFIAAANPQAVLALIARVKEAVSRATAAGQYAEQITELTGRLASVEAERDRMRALLQKWRDHGNSVISDDELREVAGHEDSKWQPVAGHLLNLRASTDAALSTPAPAGGGWRPTHRHVKRGTTYRVVSDADVQANEPIAEGTPVIVYQGHDGRYWVRPSAEFHDGRFEPLSPTEKEDDRG